MPPAAGAQAAPPRAGDEGPTPPPDSPATTPVGLGMMSDPGGARGPRRPTRYGLAVDFEERPDSTELGRLVESTVLVNTAHPAYGRAVASRSEGYHAALTVGMALAALAVEPSGTQGFLTTFLARWGEPWAATGAAASRAGSPLEPDQRLASGGRAGSLPTAGGPGGARKRARPSP
jgi:hypothetical protein